MGALQGRGDPFEPAQQLERRQGLRIVHQDIPGPLQGRQVAVLGTHPRVVEPGGDGVGVLDLAVLVLEQEGACPVEHAGSPEADAGPVPAVAFPVCLDADELHPFIVEKGAEDPDGVAPAANAGDNGIGQGTGQGRDLLPRLPADDGLELPHHGRIRVRSDGGTDEIVGGVHVGDPVPDGLAGGVLQGGGAPFHRHHLRAQEPHALHVHPLPGHVHTAHVHMALHAEERAYRGGRHAVLTGTGLGDDPVLAHAPGKQDLADGVVDLVGARVVEVFPLEPYVAPEVLREPPGMGQRCGPAHVVDHVGAELLLEDGIVEGRLHG